MKTNKINKSIKVESYDSIIKSKTRIDINEKKAEEIRKYYLKNRRDNYIPPIFSEFVISIDITDSVLETCIKNIKEDYQLLQLYETANVFDKNKIIDNMLAKFDTYKKEKKIYNSILVKYKDSINIELTFYNESNKAFGMIEAYYDSSKDDWVVNAQSSQEMIDTFKNNQDMSNFFNISFQIFLSISYYMQHFNSEIEYVEIDVKDNKKSSKNKSNGGYSQKIVLKSKKKKYVIKDTDTFEIRKRKEATYQVASWLTRGHYRKCGKNKIIKFIPPTIHKRKNLNSDKIIKKTYEIKD